MIEQKMHKVNRKSINYKEILYNYHNIRQEENNMEKARFKELLKVAKMNKKDFSKISHVPYGTINNWGLNRDGKILPVPNWVEPFMEYYFRAKKLEYIKKEICLKMREIEV